MAKILGGENAAKMNHQSMLTHVSSLVNEHNAKKLARQGALQSKSAENEQTYSGVNVQVSSSDPCSQTNQFSKRTGTTGSNFIKSIDHINSSQPISTRREGTMGSNSVRSADHTNSKQPFSPTESGTMGSNVKGSCSQTNAGQALFSADTGSMAPQSTTSCSRPGYVGGTTDPSSTASYQILEPPITFSMGPSVGKSDVLTQHEDPSSANISFEAKLHAKSVLNQSLGEQTTVKRISRSEGFYLEADIEGANVLFTIDTGATRTVISERVYNSIPEGQRPKLNKCAGLIDASGQPLSQKGSAVFTITLASGVKFKSEIMVANIEDEGLFGHDLLNQGGPEILYTEGAIRFMGVSIPCKQINKSSPIGKVRAADNFTIPGHNEIIIHAFVDRSEEDDLHERAVILEPNSDFQDKYGQFMASSLSDFNSKATHKVRILNPFAHSIKINQDTVLGAVLVNQESRCSEPPEVHHIQNTTRRIKYRVSEVPEHLQDLYRSTCVSRCEDESSRIAECLINL